MSNFVLLYKGGAIPEGNDERKAMLDAWTKWYENLGKAVVDGGNPFSSARTVAADGTVGDGAASDLSGYTIIRADNPEEAMAMVQDCPIRMNGTVVEVYETYPVAPIPTLATHVEAEQVEAEQVEAEQVEAEKVETAPVETEQVEAAFND